MVETILGVAVLGLVIGSFAGAQVWRLRARQLTQDKNSGEEYSKKEFHKLHPLTETNLSDDRSRCLSCGHTLQAVDLIPLVSWLSTGGKCRYCKHKIGTFEPLIEFGTATIMVCLVLFWPTNLASGPEIAKLILWFTASILLVMLFAYDLKWFLLPNVLVAPLVVIGAIISGVTLYQSAHPLSTLMSIAGGVLVLSGIYAAIWLISKGAWIGFGDVKLGLGLALLLANWQLSFLALFAANLIGCLVVLPGILTGKMSRTTRVPFGPLLIAGTYFSFWFGPTIISWFNTLTL